MLGTISSLINCALIWVLMIIQSNIVYSSRGKNYDIEIFVIKKIQQYYF